MMIEIKIERTPKYNVIINRREGVGRKDVKAVAS